MDIPQLLKSSGDRILFTIWAARQTRTENKQFILFLFRRISTLLKCTLFLTLFPLWHVESGFVGEELAVSDTSKSTAGATRTEHALSTVQKNYLWILNFVNSFNNVRAAFIFILWPLKIYLFVKWYVFLESSFDFWSVMNFSNTKLTGTIYNAFAQMTRFNRLYTS